MHLVLSLAQSSMGAHAVPNEVTAGTNPSRAQWYDAPAGDWVVSRYGAARTQRRESPGRARVAEDEARLLQEQLEDLSTAKEESARIADRKMTDLEMQIAASQKSLQGLEQESDQQRPFDRPSLDTDND
ncbi:hypothetical protein ACJ41O_011734 [Fusarium nematophilum]